MTTLSLHFTFTKTNTTCHHLPKLPQPTKNYHQIHSKFESFYQNSEKSHQPTKNQHHICSNFESFYQKSEKLSELKGGVLWGEKNKKRVLLVRFNNGFNFNNGGGGGGDKDDGSNVRVLGNLALAVGLTYLSLSGQLGWVLDTIVSLWLLSIVLPIVGIVAFFWWAKQDIVQSACPNCGNDFQIFKSSLNDEVQLCPFCSQPFSVEGNEFVKEPVKFSNRSSPFGQPIDDFSPRSRKGKNAATTIVDIEAEIKDVE